MNQILDILGSTAMAGVVILLMLNLNLNVSTSTAEILTGTITQKLAEASMEELEYNLYKIGHSSTNKILEADSNKISFVGDINYDDNLDTVTYYTGTFTDLAETSCPIDKPIYKLINRSDKKFIGSVSKFVLAYLDSLGNEIALSGQPSSYLPKIKSLKIDATFISPEPLDGKYPEVNYVRILRPRNIN